MLGLFDLIAFPLDVLDWREEWGSEEDKVELEEITGTSELDLDPLGVVTIGHC